jgi:hypothetical protein
VILLVGQVLVTGGVWNQIFADSWTVHLVLLGVSVAGVVIGYLTLVLFAPSVASIQRDERSTPDIA